MSVQPGNCLISEGHAWLDYHLTVRAPEQPESMELYFRVDADTKIPKLSRSTTKREGKQVSWESRFDYPDHGPDDIYALGAPKTAQIVDRTPSDEMMQILEPWKMGGGEWVIIGQFWKTEALSRALLAGHNCRRWYIAKALNFAPSILTGMALIHLPKNQRQMKKMADWWKSRNRAIPLLPLGNSHRSDALQHQHQRR